MSFVSKEIPSWVINWVNKVFTLLNAPTQIDDVFVDWVIYTDISLSWNILTLTDAPTVSIFVDYTYGATPIVVTSSITFGDIKTKVWNLLGQRNTSTIFSDPIVGDAINMEIKRVISGRVTSKLDPNRIYRCGKLWFMEWEFPIRIMAGSTLTADFAIWDTTLTCATENLLTAWYVQIGGDTFTYTNKSSTQLLWVTGGTISHLETEAIVQLYDTPIAMDKPSSVQLIIRWQYAKKFDLPLDNGDNYQTYYQIVRTGTKQLLKIVWVEHDSIVEVKYQKIVNNMTDDSDICILPDDYGITVIAYLVAGQFAFEKGMPNAQPILLSGYSALQNMYQNFTNETVITKQKLTPKSYSNFRR